eukprot:5973218-Amphidinium_carterae.1
MVGWHCVNGHSRLVTTLAYRVHPVQFCRHAGMDALLVFLSLHLFNECPAIGSEMRLRSERPRNKTTSPKIIYKL